MQSTPFFRTAIESDAAMVTEVYLTSRKAFVSFAPIAHSDEAVYCWIRDILIPSGRVTVVEQAGKISGMGLSRFSMGMVLAMKNDIPTFSMNGRVNFSGF